MAGITSAPVIVINCSCHTSGTLPGQNGIPQSGGGQNGYTPVDWDPSQPIDGGWSRALSSGNRGGIQQNGPGRHSASTSQIEVHRSNSSDYDLGSMDWEMPGFETTPKVSFKNGRATFEFVDTNGNPVSMDAMELIDTLEAARTGDAQAIETLRGIGYDVEEIQKSLTTEEPVVFNDPEHGWTVMTHGFRASGFESEQAAREFDVEDWLEDGRDSARWSQDESFEGSSGAERWTVRQLDNPTMQNIYFGGADKYEQLKDVEIHVNSNVHPPAPDEGLLPNWIPILGLL